jgi:hypothetical protein
MTAISGLLLVTLTLAIAAASAGRPLSTPGAHREQELDIGHATVCLP